MGDPPAVDPCTLPQQVWAAEVITRNLQGLANGAVAAKHLPREAVGAGADARNPGLTNEYARHPHASRHLHPTAERLELGGRRQRRWS